MALSSPGIGSGLDVQGIVQKLMTIERQPLAKLDVRVGEIRAQISAYGTLKGAVSTFRDAVGALAEPEKFKANAAQSSDPKVLGASAGSEAARGSYQIEVKRLAEAHRLATEQAQASATEAAVGLGSSLTLSVGGAAFQVDIAGKSLNEIRDAINGATGNTGVTASVFRADEGFRLMLQSNRTGSAGFIEVVNETGAPAPFRTLNADRDGQGAAPVVTRMLGNNWIPGDEPPEVRNGIAAGALTVNGIAIDAVGAGANNDEIVNELLLRINAQTAMHGVNAAMLTLADGQHRIELSHAEGGAIEVKADPLVDGGISTFFANGTTSTPAGGQPDFATITGVVMPAAQAVLVPSGPPLGHPTGVLAAGSLEINGIAIGAADFTTDLTVGGILSALVEAINARVADHHVEASIDKDGDQWTLRLTSVLGKSFDFTVYPDIDDWTAGFLYPGFVPNGYTQTVDAVTPPPQTPTPAFTAADLDAEIELEGRFTVTRSSNTLSDVIEHVTINLTGVGETTLTVDRDLASVQSSAQAIAKSYSDLVATLGRLGGTALRGERSTLGGIERELRAVLNTRVNVDSDFSNAFETGFSTQKSGALSLDTTTFGKALAQDYAGLARLFADPDQGIAKRLFELADSYLDTDALLDGRNAGLARQVREAEVRRAATEQRLKLVEGRLLKQYNTLDLVVNRLQGTNSALGSQLEAITGFYRQNRA
jgi:flagellar hook-associated protein 2